MRKVQLAPHLSSEELDRYYRQAHEPHERTWWQILWLVSRDQTAKVVADSTGYSAYWVGQILAIQHRGTSRHDQLAAHVLALGADVVECAAR